jgi:hypothetical protein
MKMKSTMTVKKTQKTTQTFRLSGDDILELLVEAGEIDAAQASSVRFAVPSGGDYSGMELEIDDNAPVLVWVENVVEDIV